MTLAPLPITANPLVISPRCEGQRGSIQVTNPSGVPPITYALNGGQTNTTGSFTQLTPGAYSIQMTDVQGCSGTINATIDQAQPFTLTLPGVVTVQLGDRIQLNPDLSIPASALALIQWTPVSYLTCSDCLNPYVDSLFQTTSYRLLVRDSSGCEKAASVRVQVEKELILEVPNVFAPDQQGNDKFFPFAYEKTLKEIDLFRIYTRWGELVFEQRKFPPNDPVYGWDGTFEGQKLNPAVFVWYLEATFVDGTKRLYKGDVTLIR